MINGGIILAQRMENVYPVGVEEFEVDPLLKLGASSRSKVESGYSGFLLSPSKPSI